MELTRYDLYFCPKCSFATIRDNPKNPLQVKCTFCGYMASKDKHAEELEDKLTKQKGLK